VRFSSYANKSGTFDADQKIKIGNALNILQIVFARISVFIRRYERIAFEQKILSTNSTVELIAKAQINLKLLVISGPSTLKNTSTSANGIALFGLVKNISGLLPQLGKLQIEMQKDRPSNQ
jgi:hypothetical protein